MYGIGSIEDQDKCMGIAYDEVSGSIAVLLQAKMKEVKGPNAGNWYDSVLLLMDSGAQQPKVVTISQGPDLQYNMFGARNGILWVDGDVFFAGAAKGFKTNYQELLGGDWSRDLDAYVYKHRFGTEASNSCLFIYEGDAQALQDNL